MDTRPSPLVTSGSSQMQAIRQLLPRKLSASSDAIREHYLPQSKVLARNRRRPPVSFACKSCQQRRTRCNGGRPSCQSCNAKGFDCIYAHEAGLSRKEGLKHKQSALQRKADSLDSLYSFLQNQDTAETHALLKRIQDGASLETALQAIEDTASTSLTSTPGNTAPGSFVGSHNVRYPHLRDSGVEDELLAAVSVPISCGELREGGESFLRCLGTMFPVLPREEFEQMMRDYEDLSGDNLDFESAQNDTRRILCGELLAICAAGLQYYRTRLSCGDSSVCTPFYQKARLFLDHVIEKDQLRAMRMCLCLGLYNVVAKSVLAVTYADWGIYIGALSGFGQRKKAPALSGGDDQKYTKVFRALITLRSWMTATLGHIPGSDVAHFIYAAEEDLEEPATVAGAADRNVVDDLQRNMARITILKARILRTTASFRTLSAPTLHAMKMDLQNWHAGLPAYMHLDTLVNHPETSSDQRRVTFYMHLFYLSAIMLKARAVLAEHETNGHCAAQYQARTTISDGLEAARSSSRLLKIIHDEGTIIKNCWLIIYHSYITCVTLFYVIIKRSLIFGNYTERDQDMKLAEHCLQVLRICATKDRIGHTFYVQLQHIKAIVAEHLSAENNPSLCDGSNQRGFNDDSWLLTPNDGETEIHQALQAVVKVLCFPFSLQKHESEGLPYPSVAESFGNVDYNFVYHLVSPFSLGEPKDAAKLFTLEGEILRPRPGNGEMGGFLDGDSPHGWASSAWKGGNQEGKEDSSTSS